MVAIYLALTMAYTLWLKHEPVLDISIIATGFLLRAIAGGAAADIALSQWFLLSATFGSLFMAAGKRYAEARLEPQEAVAVRRSLAGYTPTYLRFVWTMSAGLLIMTYGLWAFELGDAAATGSVLFVVSMAPFVLGGAALRRRDRRRHRGRAGGDRAARPRPPGAGRGVWLLHPSPPRFYLT